MLVMSTLQSTSTRDSSLGWKDEVGGSVAWERGSDASREQAEQRAAATRSGGLDRTTDRNIETSHYLTLLT